MPDIQPEIEPVDWGNITQQGLSGTSFEGLINPIISRASAESGLASNFTPSFRADRQNIDKIKMRKYKLTCEITKNPTRYIVSIIVTNEKNKVVSESSFNTRLKASRNLASLASSITEDTTDRERYIRVTIPQSMDIHTHLNRFDRNALSRRDGTEHDEEDLFDLDIQAIENAVDTEDEEVEEESNYF